MLLLGYPFLCHVIILAVIAGLAVIGAVMRFTLLMIVPSVFLVFIGVSWLWSWYAMRRLNYDLTLSKSRAFPGDTVDLNSSLSNNKSLTLPWAEVEMEMPPRLSGRVKDSRSYNRERLKWTTSLSAGQEIKWQENVECRVRGDYEIGPVRVRSGDIFGMFPRELLLPVNEQLLVYPRIVPVEKLNIPLKELVGEKETPRSFYEDNSRTMGSREYQPGDAFKRIHWKASARHGQLQTRQYESTTSLSLVLLFDVYSFCQIGTADEENFETGVTTVASLANEICSQEFPVGLIANSLPEIDIPAGTGRSHLLLILESLARVEQTATVSLQQHLNRAQDKLMMGGTLAIITGDVSLSAGLVRILQQQGRSVVLLNVGVKAGSSNIGDCPVISVAAGAQSFGAAKLAS